MKRLERLEKRTNRSERIIGPELARSLCEISLEIQRQIGLLIDRRGRVRVTVVGDAHSLFLPDLSAWRLGRNRLCGLRLVHTHLNGAPLNDDDLTDLALLRLDLIAAIEIQDNGLAGKIFTAHLLPDNDRGEVWEVLPPVNVHDLPDDCFPMIDALEDEFARTQKSLSATQKDRAILVSVSQNSRIFAEDSLAELRELTRSTGIEVVHTAIQRRPVDPKYVMGKGKLQSIVIKAMQLDAEIVIFDLNLTPSQVKILADFTDLKILDRTQVILDIFAQHAQTREGKLQVELAQLRYLLPRLSAKHTAMSRLTGGIGGRGPGETKLEVNRRRAQERLTRLEREVTRLGKRRKLRRGVRTRKGVPIVSIVGYTNAGKSTLLNNLTNSKVVAEDALFATLNPVSRRLRIPREREIIMTDTVGFIRDLPVDLKAAFRTTFEELDESDLLLHVMNASSKDIDKQFETVTSLLAELHLNDKPILVVLNKTDLCDKQEIPGLASRYNAIPICALDRGTFSTLLEEMYKRLWSEV